MPSRSESDWPALDRVSVTEMPAADEASGRFGLLYEVGKRLLLASVEELNQLALSLAFETLRAQRGALLLRRPGEAELVPVLQWRRDRGPVVDEVRVPTSIVREVVANRVGILTSDALEDPRFESRVSVQRSSVRSALCAPLWNGESVLGVLYLDSPVEAYAFDRDDLVFLNALANLIAIRLEQEAMHGQLVHERIVRSNLARYHSPDVVEAILAKQDADGALQTGLEEREASVLFVDLQGFTLAAEQQPPVRIAAFLDAYYDLVTEVVFAWGGTINDYLGDGVMALFGAPVAYADHASRALSAARGILAELAASQALEAYEIGTDARIGINSGSVVVGSIGSADRLKYAVIGDAVNVASRLQGVAEPGHIVIGEQTRRLLGDAVACSALGPQQLRGRARPVEAFEVVP